jgi:hydroxyacylglutathione hydrolase
VTLEVVSLALGAYQTNCYVVSTEGSTDAVVIDPGDSAETVLRVLAERGLTLRGILVTHGHLDHIGAVRDLAEQTGVEVWMARDDADDLRTFGPAPYDPQHGVSGGDEVEVAGIGFRVLDVPGHTAGSVAFVTDGVAFVGDVLFAGSIGRTDLQGGDLDTLIASIELLMRELPPETVVASGHGPATTLERERETNPFLGSLR